MIVAERLFVFRNGEVDYERMNANKEMKNMISEQCYNKNCDDCIEGDCNCECHTHVQREVMLDENKDIAEEK